MAKNTVAKSRRAGEQPVKSGIHRAAKRIGLEVAEAPAEPLDRTDEELDVLRNLADAAEVIFEHHGEVTIDPVNILREALRSTKDDIGTIGDAEGAGGGVPSMCFRRVELRIDLALALFEYRQQFGYIESEDQAKVLDQFEAMESRAAGGVS